MKNIKKLKSKNCKQCGEIFTPLNSFIPVCSVDCAIKYANAKKEKKAVLEKKRRDSQYRKDRLELKRKDRSWQLSRTRDSFNKLRRLQEFKWFKDRNMEPYCISCGKTHATWSCGHYKTTKSNPGMRFDPKNTFLQCWWQCNRNFSGNIDGHNGTIGFRKGILKRFGEKEGQEILDYVEDRTKRSDWTCEELEQMRKDFNRQIRELENELQR